MAKFYRLSVKEIRKETLNSVSISFLVPDSLKETFSFIPGQYITLQKELNGEQVRRDYSICSSLNSGELKVGIKAVENGTFSQYATSQLLVGDELEVSAPHGRFNLNPNSVNTKNYIAFAAGSGITPILSMIRSALEEESASKFILVYGNRTMEEMMFKEDLERLKEIYADRFFLHNTFSQAVYEGHESGRIDGDFANSVLDKAYEGMQFDSYFLCGPEPMINAVKASLKNRGISEKNIHFELFTSSATAENEAQEFKGESQITVLLDDEEETFTMKSEQTILESALLQGLDAPYSCQGGICSTCIAQITEGKAMMEKNTILSDEEVEDGLVLTCQAHPVTPKIVIDYDNV